MVSLLEFGVLTMGNGGYWNGEFIGVWSFNIQVSKITILFINRMGNGGYWSLEF